ncbi:MAG: hypothetical protein ACYSTS_07945 [Planctomycetota bacterium]|jgi:hypothetical protein
MEKKIFDLNTPEEFFRSICLVLERYKISTAKNIEDLLYVLMGLNHLREWIAPCYNWKNPPETPSQKFYHSIFKTPEFRTVNALCNRSKHLELRPDKTPSEYDLKIDDWPEIDSVRNFDLGPASNYFVDGKNITNVLDGLVEYYKENWFNS